MGDLILFIIAFAFYTLASVGIGAMWDQTLNNGDDPKPVLLIVMIVAGVLSILAFSSFFENRQLGHIHRQGRVFIECTKVDALGIGHYKLGVIAKKAEKEVTPGVEINKD